MISDLSLLLNGYDRPDRVLICSVDFSDAIACLKSSRAAAAAVMSGFMLASRDEEWYVSHNTLFVPMPTPTTRCTIEYALGVSRLGGVRTGWVCHKDPVSFENAWLMMLAARAVSGSCAPALASTAVLSEQKLDSLLRLASKTPPPLNIPKVNIEPLGMLQAATNDVSLPDFRLVTIDFVGYTASAPGPTGPTGRDLLGELRAIAFGTAATGAELLKELYPIRIRQQEELEQLVSALDEVGRHNGAAVRSTAVVAGIGSDGRTYRVHAKLVDELLADLSNVLDIAGYAFVATIAELNNESLVDSCIAAAKLFYRESGLRTVEVPCFRCRGNPTIATPYERKQWAYIQHCENRTPS